MSNLSLQVLLNWAAISVSVFNTILLLWLGLTVLLTAERRDPGVWLVVLGSFAGSLFFVSHSVLLGIGWYGVNPAVEFWWIAGLLPLVVCPLFWYIAILWFSGYGSTGDNRLKYAHRIWLIAISGVSLALFGLLLFTRPAAQINRLGTLDWQPSTYFLAIFPLYSLACTALALHALHFPKQEPEDMRAAARRQARPWLVVASLLLLLVSLSVTAALVWILERSLVSGLNAVLVQSITVVDLIIDGLIALAILVMGQAIVTYEIFSSQHLPRATLSRQWLRIILLSAGYSFIIGGSFALDLQPIYSLLLTASLMTVFFALLGWRSLAERKAMLAAVRPFVSSQRMYASITSPTPDLMDDLYRQFEDLCQQILNCQFAAVIPRGAFSSLINTEFHYPPNSASSQRYPEFLSQFDNSGPFLPLNPQAAEGYLWAVSLWNETGLIGTLLLGPKSKGAIYTQEELELAQAACERLLDVKASSELTRYLLELQKQNLVETQILDRHTRRVLHDEILPQIHTLILEAQVSNPADQTAQLTALHSQISNLLHSMPPTSSIQFQKSGLLPALHQVIEQECAAEFASVNWDIEPQAAARLSELPDLNQEVIFFAARELIRNAARHNDHEQTSAGMGLTLNITLGWQDGLSLTIQDNGRGMTGKENENAGGYGLALHSAMMAIIGGRLTLEDQDGVCASLYIPVNALNQPG
jgi:anti-sigma regulatory factor (Ser/Thr protein kinase)